MHPLPFSGPPIYPILFWSTYTFWAVLESVTALSKRSSDPTKARDKGSYSLLLLLVWVAIGSDFALAFLLPQATILWRGSLVFFIGIGLMIAGMAFRFYAMSFLGKFFTYDVAVHAGQTVIEAGPYRYIRHPSYTGAFMTMIGLALALGNWAGLLVVVGCMGTAYAYRISVEEAALVAALGEPYKQYMQRTRRLIPFLF